MSIFKDTFISETQDQLKNRQEAISKRTPDSIKYLNSRNAWIKMSSSVNVDGSNELASTNQIKGGILSPQGIREGVFNPNNLNASYDTQTPLGKQYNRGLRPMPGINSIDIKSKSAYGSLREVVVNFQCWDIKQLEDLELLYMRPGYTVLVEWGWLPYLDNSNNGGKIQRNIPGGTYDIIEQTPPKEKIWKELFEKSKLSGGNYDAMFGYIKNYSWSAREDGGYDCTTTIISIGEILESLKVNYSPLTINLNKNSKGLLNKKVIGLEGEKKYKKNILTGLFSEIYNIVKDDNSEIDEIGKTYRLKFPKSDTMYDFFIKKLKITNSSIDDDKLIHNEANTINIYIKLKSLTDILNEYVILKDNKNNTSFISVSTNEREYDKSPPSSLSPLLCLGHPLQISVDPTICLIGNDLWSTIPSPSIKNSILNLNVNPISSDGLTFIESRSTTSTITKLLTSISSRNSIQYLKKLDSYFLNEKKELGIIGNIYVNLQFLYTLSLDGNLESQDKKEKQEINIYDFIKNILSSVSNSIGNVNNFDIHIDPIDCQARIIDINYVNEKNKDEAFKEAFTLEIHNLKSTVRSYKLESQIFPEQSTIIAIGAQVQGGALSVDSNTMNGFNRGIIDRIIPVKIDPTVNNDSDKENAKKLQLTNLRENLQTIYKFFGDATSSYLFSPQPSFDVNSAAEYKGALRDLIIGFISFTDIKSKYNSIIPTKLSIEMDGIGGLVIGHIFKIPNDLLPKGYKGDGLGSKLGHIITGIGHKISGNDWTTSIDAQNIILDDPTPGVDGETITVEELIYLINNPPPEVISSQLEQILKSNSINSIGSTNPTSSINPIDKYYIPSLNIILPLNKYTSGRRILLTAQTQKEGFKPGNINFDLNNPGNFTKTVGNISIKGRGPGTRSRFVEFFSLEDGIKASSDQLDIIIEGKSSIYPKNPTLLEYIEKYAPLGDGDNNPREYTNYIVNFFKMKNIVIFPNTLLKDIIDIK